MDETLFCARLQRLARKYRQVLDGNRVPLADNDLDPLIDLALLIEGQHGPFSRFRSIDNPAQVGSHDRYLVFLNDEDAAALSATLGDDGARGLLDELVENALADAAAAINNEGPRAQIEYLLGHGYTLCALQRLLGIEAKAA